MIYIDGKDVRRMHIVRVYDDDIGLENIHHGLRKLNKIKEEHINLSPRHQIRVTLGTQVNKFNVFIFDMYVCMSMFPHPVIMDKVHFIISQGFTRRKYLGFFPRFRWIMGGGRGAKIFTNIYFFLQVSSYFIHWRSTKSRSKLCCTCLEELPANKLI